LNGEIPHLVGRVPLVGPAMQLRNLVRHTTLQAVHQEIAHQVVIPIPAIFFIDRRQQQLLMIERFQQLGAAWISCNGLAQRTVKTVKDGGLKKKIDDLVGLGRKRILEESRYFLRRT